MKRIIMCLAVCCQGVFAAGYNSADPLVAALNVGTICCMRKCWPECKIVAMEQNAHLLAT
jgi:hypothetical protein